MLISEETKEHLEELGYESLEEYFECLSEDYGVAMYAVKAIASILGESELFDGVVTAIEDASESYFD